MSDATTVSSPNPSDGSVENAAKTTQEGATIVICPICETRYQVAAEALGGPAGREVRCASCGNAWHYSPEGAAIQAALADTAAAARPAASFPAVLPADEVRPPPLSKQVPRVAEPGMLPRSSAALEIGPGRRRRFGWIGLAAIAAAAILIALIGREAMLGNWFSASRLYAQLRPAAAPGDGLKVSVTPTRTADSLVIKGAIINSAASVRPIPRLRVSLRDDHKAILASKVIAPPVKTLPPGKSAHFDTTFQHPSDSATGVEVTFSVK
jgi:predicted Zn finger-like uncharacterized protein